MKTLLTAGALVLAMAVGRPLCAGEAKAEAKIDADTAAADAPAKSLVVGGFMGMGLALGVGNYDEEWYGDKKAPRFAGAGGAYLNYYFNDKLALDFGLGFAGKGYRFTGPAQDDRPGVDKYRQTYIDLEIPVGIKAVLGSFQLYGAIAFDVVIAGKRRAKEEAGDSKTSVEFAWAGEGKDNVLRFNLGPKLGAGYEIPIGPVTLVSGLYWSMDILDRNKKGDIGDRAMNIMIVVAGEIGIPKKK